jgi:hypothetical protein
LWPSGLIALKVCSTAATCSDVLWCSEMKIFDDQDRFFGTHFAHMQIHDLKKLRPT